MANCKKVICMGQFEKKGDGIVVCNKCNKILEFFGNTTNLSEHLDRLRTLLLNQESENLSSDNENPVKVQTEDNLEKKLQIIPSTSSDGTSIGVSVPMKKSPRQLTYMTVEGISEFK